MTDHTNLPECFLCCASAETGPLYKVCKCNTLVHADCFRKLLALPAYATSCAVCKSEYDTRTTTRHKCVVREEASKCALYVCILTSTTVVLGSVGLWYHVRDQPYTQPQKHVGFVIIFASYALSCLLLMGFHYNITKRCCCVHCDTVVVGTTLVLPAESIVSRV